MGVKEQVEVRMRAGLVDDHGDAQLGALKTALLFAAALVGAAFLGTRDLPTQRFGPMATGLGRPLDTSQ